MFGAKKDIPPDAENICPMLAGPCIKARCMWWIHIRGKNPQNGAEIDLPDCSVKYIPVLLMENGKATHEAGASVDALRNVVADGNNKILKSMTEGASSPFSLIGPKS